MQGIRTAGNTVTDGFGNQNNTTTRDWHQNSGTQQSNSKTSNTTLQHHGTMKT
jgi:hypothetical protein